MSKTLMLGAVAYDPKVVTIWEGFRAWFAQHDLDFDFILYSNYEAQVAGHFAGHYDVAWNSPLAWIQAERVAKARGSAAPRRAARRLCVWTGVRRRTPLRGTPNAPLTRS